MWKVNTLTLVAAVVIPASVISTSCATTSSKPQPPNQELDILSSANDAKQASTDWHPFFKGAPTPTERLMIQKNLDRWVDTGSVDGLLQKARNEVAIGRIAQAEVTLREAIRRKDDNPETSLELIQIYIRKKDSQRAFEALAQVRGAIRTSDRDHRELLFKYRYNLAMAHLLRGDRDRANTILTDLVAIDPKFAAGYTALASSYLSAGKSEVAEFVARRGLDRGAEDAGLYNVLGLAIERQGRASEAIASYDRGLQLNGAHVPTLINRGAMAIRAGDCKEGLELMQRALAYSPGESNAHVGLGTCYKRSGNSQKAGAAFARAIELDPENATARYNLALVYSEEKGKEGEAVRLFREVLQSSEENQEVRTMAAARLKDLELSDGDEN